MAHIAARRDLDQVAGAEDVVADSLADVDLHERHVLVGGGVEDKVGLMPRE